MESRASILRAALLLASVQSGLSAQALPPGIEVPTDATQVLTIWPGAAPGTEISGQPEQTMPSAEDRLVRNVEVPTLTAFLPEQGAGNGTAVIVAPGGGNIVLSIDSEGYEVARWLRDRGVAAFVLRYRLRPTGRDATAFMEDAARLDAQLARLDSMSPVEIAELMWEPAAEDGQQAVRVIRSRAAEWGIRPNRIGILGFSAGGWVVNHVAMSYDAESRPDFAASIYAGLAEQVAVPPDAPPLFIAYAVDDPLMNGAVDVVSLFDAWRKAGRPVEFHAYERGGHGFGMSTQNSTSDDWIDALGEWMALHDLLP